MLDQKVLVNNELLRFLEKLTEPLLKNGNTLDRLKMNLNIKKQLQSAVVFLSSHTNPKLEAETLLASMLGKERVWLKTHDNQNLSLMELLKFKYWVHLRARGVPLAYIRGYQDWYGQKFVVNKSVLIPRDETETLLTHILDTKYKILPNHILDVGTGSGCLAIELKRAFPDSEVLALDISDKALKVARANAKGLGQAVDFQKSDLLSAIPKNTHLDIIVANLPYVPETIEVTLEVKQEPHSAIFSGPDGLDHLRRFAVELSKKNITFGTLWLEFLPTQKDKIQEIFSIYKIKLKADVAGNEFFARITV